MSSAPVTPRENKGTGVQPTFATTLAPDEFIANFQMMSGAACYYPVTSLTTLKELQEVLVRFAGGTMRRHQVGLSNQMGQSFVNFCDTPFETAVSGDTFGLFLYKLDDPGVFDQARKDARDGH